MAPPAGYTQLSYQGNSGIDVHMLVFYRIADGTEGSTIDFTYNVFLDKNIGAFAMRISGSNIQSPSVMWSSPEDYFSFFVDYPSTPTTSDNSLIIAALAFDGSDGDPFVVSAGTPPWPSELDEYLENPPDSFTGLGLGYISRLVENSGDPTETLTLTGNATDGIAALLIQINNS